MIDIQQIQYRLDEMCPNGYMTFLHENGCISITHKNGVHRVSVVISPKEPQYSDLDLIIIKAGALQNIMKEYIDDKTWEKAEDKNSRRNGSPL